MATNGYTDLNVQNGWIPEVYSSQVLTRDYQVSVVEQVARTVRMNGPLMSVPRFDSQGADIVPEHAVIPVQTGALDNVILQSVKWADRFIISVEDQRDALADVLQAKKAAWLDSFSRKFDNACLGTTAAADGVNVPFESVYRVAGSTGRLQTAGSLSFAQLGTIFTGIEQGDYGSDLVIIAHPAFSQALRSLTTPQGFPLVADPLGGGTPSIFGNPVYISRGARTSATATHAPTGNPLLVVASRRNLIVGVHDGPESQVSDQPQWATDEVELKLRARRAFVAATPDAFRVVELTAGA